MSEDKQNSMLSNDEDERPLELTPAAQELLERMHLSFTACRSELILGENLLRTFGGADPESGRLASDSSAGRSVFSHPELDGLARRLEELEVRSREGIRDPALRELAERVTSQSSAMVLWTTHFMFDFGERLRALEGAIEAGSISPAPSGSSA